jgi:membrane-associated protease RseP (regulator of RpoE activity)
MIPSLLGTLILDFALILFALTAHELGHIVVARIFHVKVKKIGFTWLGPYVRRARTTGWREVAICMAGAAVNLILALAFWHVSHWFGLFNLTVGIVNILPITHSDGSHALQALHVLQAPVKTRTEESEAKAA